MSRHDAVVAAAGSSIDQATAPPGDRAWRLHLPSRLDLTPVDDGDFARLLEVGRAIDETVSAWLAGTGHDRLFVTFATPDFALGASVLSRSLRAVSDLPVLILTQGDVQPDIAAEGVALLRVPPLLRPGHVFPHDARHLAVTLSKLWVFSLTRPRRVAFVDADCLVLQPLDGLFEGDGFAAVPDLFANYDRPGFNSGVFAFTPSPEIRESLFRDLPQLSVADGDQGILNVFFPEWRQLPQGFNLLRSHALLRAEARDKALRVVHYTPSKPWTADPLSPRDPLLAPLDDLWTARLTPDEHLALVRDWRARLATSEANIAAWMDAGAARRRLRQERHQRRWILALAAIQILQAGLLAGLLLR